MLEIDIYPIGIGSYSKVADYPFDLVPNLGVIKVDAYRSFVVADIQG